MGNLSAGEIVILLVIALLVFGGKGLPEAGRTIGKGLRDFRRSWNEAQDALGRPDQPSAPEPPDPGSAPKRLLE
jgi:TatA/E family protein of Tat protein translocase